MALLLSSSANVVLGTLGLARESVVVLDLLLTLLLLSSADGLLGGLGNGLGCVAVGSQYVERALWW